MTDKDKQLYNALIELLAEIQPSTPTEAVTLRDAAKAIADLTIETERLRDRLAKIESLCSPEAKYFVTAYGLAEQIRAVIETGSIIRPSSLVAAVRKKRKRLPRKTKKAERNTIIDDILWRQKNE